MRREDMLARATDRREPWDVAVIGGGATGVGVAVDAASRGYSVLLVERGDFGVGTSSRSTKLVHGGVRYLRQGNVRLVTDALRERGRLRRNAPHVVHDLAFVLPCYRRFDLLKFGVGLTAYDLLAGRERFGRSRVVSAAETVRRLPTVRSGGLRGGVVYHDGQFDDARLLIDLVRTAADHGAVVLNYAPAVGLTRDPGGRIDGVIVRDAEGGAEWRAAARAVVNAAGPFCDEVRRLADPAARPLVAASQGSHVVLPRAFLPGHDALLVPETPDGRVLFVIPWLGHTLVGTTDVAVPTAPAEPTPAAAEIDFILETAGRYLAKPPTRSDVLSTFAGVRPLVKAGGGATAALSRDHTIREDAPGLLTITGGKWTTYRAMAEDCVDQAAALAGLPRRPCRTATMPIRPPDPPTVPVGEGLHPALPYSQGDVVRAARSEMARTVEDVLSRRLRVLPLNAAAAVPMAPQVAELIAGELGRDRAWEDEQVRAFTRLAAGYRPPSR
jgi:glycerol-3-phosphate dehydrogenase